jgi:hypothetical protein
MGISEVVLTDTEKPSGLEQYIAHRILRHDSQSSLPSALSHYFAPDPNIFPVLDFENPGLTAILF